MSKADSTDVAGGAKTVNVLETTLLLSREKANLDLILAWDSNKSS